MHILYLHQYYCPPGGSGNDRSRAFAAAWVKAGHRVTVVTSPAWFPHSMKQSILKENKLVHEFIAEGVEVKVLPIDYSHMMGSWARMKAFYDFYRKGKNYCQNLHDVDRIYASSSPLQVGTLGAKLSKKWAVPLIYETVDVWPDVPIDMGIVRGLPARIFTRQANRIYAKARDIVALSAGMKAQIMQHGVPSAKITVIPNGTDTEQFPFVQREPGEITQVIYTGTVGVANDLSQLVEAAAILEKQGRDDIQFTIVGSGNDFTRVEDAIASQKLRHVKLIPTVPKEEVMSLLVKAHIGVVSFAPFQSLEANSANKFFDYLASGLPVAINYEGWQGQLLAEHRCGLSAPQGDVNAFANQLIRLADDAPLRKQMGVNARDLAVTQFDRRNLAAQALPGIDMETGIKLSRILFRAFLAQVTALVLTIAITLLKMGTANLAIDRPDIQYYLLIWFLPAMAGGLLMLTLLYFLSGRCAPFSGRRPWLQVLLIGLLLYLPFEIAYFPYYQLSLFVEGIQRGLGCGCFVQNTLPVAMLYSCGIAWVVWVKVAWWVNRRNEPLA
jgi:glycosyltransferase involved in cell wall biosynthesis